MGSSKAPIQHGDHAQMGVSIGSVPRYRRPSVDQWTAAYNASYQIAYRIGKQVEIGDSDR